jgi:anti-sigma B factor antagonist
MSSSITRKLTGEALILNFKGKLTIGEGQIRLRNAISEALSEGFRKIVLDLTECSTIDSNGIGELVAAYTFVTSRGGAVKVGGLSLKVADVLTITQLITVFEVYEDAESAAAAFGGKE